VPYKGSGPLIADLLGGPGRLGGDRRARHPGLPDEPVPGGGRRQHGGPYADHSRPSDDRRAGLSELRGGWLVWRHRPREDGVCRREPHPRCLRGRRGGAGEVREAMLKQGNLIAPTSPEAAAAFFRSEEDKYEKIVRSAGVTVTCSPAVCLCFDKVSDWLHKGPRPALIHLKRESDRSEMKDLYSSYLANDYVI